MEEKLGVVGVESDTGGEGAGGDTEDGTSAGEGAWLGVRELGRWWLDGDAVEAEEFREDGGEECVTRGEVGRDVRASAGGSGGGAPTEEASKTWRAA